MGMIYAFMTATRVEWDGTGDVNGYTEEHGWIDTRDMFELVESRNYVRPLVQERPDSPDLADAIEDAFNVLGPCDDNGDGTFYGHADKTADDGSNWTYALHFMHKHNGPHGWTETDWHPVTDGRVTLP